MEKLPVQENPVLLDVGSEKRALIAFIGLAMRAENEPHFFVEELPEEKLEMRSPVFAFEEDVVGGGEISEFVLQIRLVECFDLGVVFCCEAVVEFFGYDERHFEKTGQRRDVVEQVDVGACVEGGASEVHGASFFLSSVQSGAGPKV